MTIQVHDNVLKDPVNHTVSIYERGFIDFDTEAGLFKNVQDRELDDEFAIFVSKLFPEYDVSLNFARMSPFEQREPNFIHTDEDMGDLTCILYLSVNYPPKDGTTIYDEDCNKICVIHSKFNRMCAFDSRLLHSRNIYDNFGMDRQARLIQVAFLKRRYEGK